MKMRLLKTLAFGFTMAIMASSTGVFADHSSSSFDESSEQFNGDRHCFNRRKIVRLNERIRRDLAIEFASLNNIYTFLGASPNPNPLTNPAVAGLIAVNTSQIVAAEADFINALRELGVPENALTVISAQSAAFFTAALAYAVNVNLANTGQPSGDQIADAVALQTAAQSLGISFLALTHNPQFTEILTTIANLSTQAVQAYRGVLNDANTFGATPGDPASETNAAVVINGLILELSRQFAFTLVPELAHEACSNLRF